MKFNKKNRDNKVVVRNIKNILKAITDQKYCLLVGTGTYAIQIALQSLSNEKKNVLIPSLTCISVPMAVKYANCVNVFVEIDPSTLNMKTESIVEKINANTKAIIATHLFGNPIDIPVIQKKVPDVIIIEDAAQALGAKLNNRPVGSFGHISVFSFNQKIIDCGGAAILMSDKKTFERMKTFIRCNSSRIKFTTSSALYKLFFQTANLLYRNNINIFSLSRSISGAFKNKFSSPYPLASTRNCVPLLKKININIENRRKKAKMWREHLLKNYFRFPSMVNDNSAYWRFSFLLKSNNVSERESFFKKCNKLKLPLGRLYYPPLHEIFYKKNVNLPIASDVSRKICNLPTEDINERDIKKYASLINQIALESFRERNNA